ncbi:hypothetical protein C8Q74DRAFT_1235065 [Fomes fomentarius]|nr:hypothetical protein C8Q74DRAFT_1235065 [Fomes fomentarius]
MLFTSLADPDTKSTQQLIIFCHSQERVILPLPKSYDDAQEAARQQFSLTGQLFFEADDLGSESHAVRIHPMAWEGISPILRSVTVRLGANTPPASRPRPSNTLSSGPGSRRLSSQKRISVVGSTPLRLSKGSDVVAPQTVERQSLSARKAPIGAPSPRPSSVYVPIVEASSSSVKSCVPSVRSVTHETSTSKIEELDDDEEEEIRILSSPKKRGTRPRILSDYGVEEAEDGSDDSPATDVTHIVDDEDFDQLEEDFASAGRSLSRSQRIEQSTTLSRSGSGSLVELDGQSTSSGSRKAERSSSVRHLDAPPAEQSQPKIKIEKTPAKPATEVPPPSSQLASQSQPKGDESFLIMIEYSEDPESRSLFKTRGRHTVSKVLMQACRTFGLEEYYSSARLVLLVEEEDDSGEIVFQRRYGCNRNDTMADAGAEPHAKFVVELVDENEEDDV